jgi:protein tyrosine phosphatase (PTP) superfamily phosphohydrolase (DUF442 family)
VWREDFVTLPGNCDALGSITAKRPQFRSLVPSLAGHDGSRHLSSNRSFGMRGKDMHNVRRTSICWVLALAGVALVTAQQAPAGAAASISHTNWAEAITREGLPNLHKVSATLYRGAQPEEKGYAQLKALGIKTVVNLRALHPDRLESEASGLKHEGIVFNTWHPEEKDVARFLRIVSDPTNVPVFVHCQHGADRTGMMCAIYRIVVQGWTKAEAIDEMTHGGFGFHSVWKNLIEYIEKLDVDKLRRQLGTTE